MKRSLLLRLGVVVFFGVLLSCRNNVDMPKYLDTTLSIEERVNDLLDQLTLEEKVKLTYGDFYSGGVPRLGINKLLVMDGPVGIRLSCIQSSKYKLGDEVQTGENYLAGLPERTSALPSTLSLAASWDRKATYDYANIIANEMLAINAHVLLAPGINLMRDPRGGRNFEYMGEDPYLTAEMAIAYTKGLQDKRVGVNLKHYVANENDNLRHLTSSQVDEKTLREVYVYPFERAINEADAWSIMTSNNLLNGVHLGNNEYGLKEIMREQIGFDGVILTDWRSAYKAKPSVDATLDMPTGFCSYVYEDELLDLVASGKVSESTLDEMVKRILCLYIRSGVINPETRQKGAVNIPAFQHRIRELTANSMVLLKNKHNALPLSSNETITVTGPGAVETISGGGSSSVNHGIKRQTIAESLKAVFGDHMTLETNSEMLQRENEVIVYCATGQPGSEGDDMPDILLEERQINEINRLGNLTDKLVVLLQNSSAVDMTLWNNSADAILLTWLGGQSFGDAVTDVVIGKISPSGRLPFTMGNSIADYPCEILNTWPSTAINSNPYTKPGRDKEDRMITYEKAPQFIMDYREKDLIGYRGFIANEIEPMYPFGFGLSYTNFDISDLNIKQENGSYAVSCLVKNVGKQKGADVVQLYITKPDEIVKTLRGFEKVELNAGESKLLTINLRGNDLSSFDKNTKKWIAKEGKYTVELSDRSAVSPQLKSNILLNEMVFFETP